MAFVEVNPRYREQLERLGLRTPADFLALSGVILCGHPDRHVSRLTFGKGGAALHAFLKREHRTRWRDRLANAWAGFGFTSKSYREYRLLRQLTAAGVGCPEPIAAGEDGQGRAFLLLREVAGAHDLRAFLARTALTSEGKHTVARRLGSALARMHAAGFDHPDLYSKHVLVSGTPGPTLTFHFLDWQRSRRGRLGWRQRWRDLAALDATLAEELATPRERLACLRAYLRSTAASGLRVPALASAARQVRRRTSRLLTRRRIRELRQPALPVGAQNLIWLDGEALAVTRAFRAEIEHIPEWLTLPIAWTSESVSRRELMAGSERRTLLVRRCSSRPLAWLWAWLRRQRLASPELEQSGLLFRLQRYGVLTPRLLAVGHRSFSWPWRTASMLLTEPLPGTLSLVDWLQREASAEHGRILGELGAVLSRIHAAGCCLNPHAAGEVFLVQTPESEPPRIVLGNVDGLRRQQPTEAVVQHDLALLHATIAPICDRRSRRQLVLGYLGVRLLRTENPSPPPPPRNGEGEQDSHAFSSPPLRCGEGVGGRGLDAQAEGVAP
ncbi:MAG TPA: lipopolysaccharide kinase InaA family protein [Gemmataceae bacterium]|nr:lipopolysaccharide kinase InaA family protein [Gemmataceae bacterium]